MDSRLRVGILGTGKLGTDLLIKVLRSPYLNCVLFAGRNGDSPGINKARELGVSVSSDSIEAFDRVNVDLAFDVTNAEYHKIHAGYFAEKNIRAVDLTPAKVGPFCIPSVNPDLLQDHHNVNLVTCGGQASIPLIQALSSVYRNVSWVKLTTHLAEDSVGPATLANLDEYYTTTALAVQEFTGVADVDVQLTVEKSAWKPDMYVDIRAGVEQADIHLLYPVLQQRLQDFRRYVPGYSVVGTPSYDNGELRLIASVRGSGDWIPGHAGNLDIINCAAVEIANRYARFAMADLPEEEEKRFNVNSLLSRFNRKRASTETGGLAVE